VIGGATLRGEPQQVLKLVKEKEATGTGHKPEDHALGHAPGQVSQAQQGDTDLERADQESHEDSGRNLVGLGDGGKGTQQGDGDGVGGAVD